MDPHKISHPWVNATAVQLLSDELLVSTGSQLHMKSCACGYSAWIFPTLLGIGRPCFTVVLDVIEQKVVKLKEPLQFLRYQQPVCCKTKQFEKQRQQFRIMMLPLIWSL
eukprot:GHVU01123849.1.p1 GENE.GHVU01123849.1~~GHVU01123849.1.p1  ORF type:complete len:109 (+),score=1.26 GHVU01123849.1:785-1111(+)